MFRSTNSDRRNSVQYLQLFEECSVYGKLTHCICSKIHFALTALGLNQRYIGTRENTTCIYEHIWHYNIEDIWAQKR